MVVINLEFGTDRVAPEKAIHPESLCRTFISGTITGDSIMKRIKLTQGKFALVDDEDFAKLSKYKWHSLKGTNTFYAARGFRLRMHRFILNAKEGQEIDHRDGNGLNNQKSNLRFCTHSQNNMNQRKLKKNLSSKYKGVSWHKNKKKWAVSIYIDGKNKYLGDFKDETDAAEAYNEAAMKYYGEFANLNTIP